MSRWRESSGVSFGSQIVPPARVELRERLREPAEVLEVGHRRVAPHVALAHERRPVDGRERHVSPPMWIVCSGLRACTSNSRGAFATCSSTNSGSSLTR